MFTAQFTQNFYLSWRSLQHCQGPLIQHRTKHACRIYGPILPTLVNMASANETSMNICSGVAMPDSVIRRYQVVVAATRDMGIGKDGKLPWTLPSDLRYFKEVTTSTSVAGMRNAVIMGRKTWESIPLKYRPLPGRLNVVLSRSGKLGLAALEDLVICTDLNSALKLLAEPPISLSVEKVFIIGGGQVLKETLNATGCEAIHLTDIKTKVECDTYIPRIDSSSFVPLLSSKEMVENNIRFSFLTYVRMNNSAEESTTTENSSGICSIETNKVKSEALREMHAEFDYLKQIQERITGSGTFDRSV